MGGPASHRYILTVFDIDTDLRSTTTHIIDCFIHPPGWDFHPQVGVVSTQDLHQAEAYLQFDRQPVQLQAELPENNERGGVVTAGCCFVSRLFTKESTDV